MDVKLEEKLAHLPQKPGVYLMKDAEGTVIYVGKAVNLRSRVKSYFNRTGDTRAFVALLDDILADVETVLVGNEKEALLVENELIKKHKPRFNVKLVDDKNFICLRLSTRHPFPRLEVVRRFQKDGAKYFGPYASAASIRETLRIVNRYFGLRTCSDHVLENRKRPCLLYQIGRCPAPCVLPVDEAVYAKSVEEVSLFLEGRAGELTESLRARMKRASSELRFEEAARVRDQLFAIERSLERQAVALSELVDQDAFGLYREGDRLLIYVLYIRRGRMAGGQSFFFSGQEFPDEELLSSFVSLYYLHDNLVPDCVLLPFELEGKEGLAQLLEEKKGEKVRVVVPKRGERMEVLRRAHENAESSFRERRRDREEMMAVLERLKARLHLRNLPRRMECFDISHFQGASMVGSQVASSDGELDKARYRRFKIKSTATVDDFASLHEVLKRRLKRGLLAQDLPDLFVIDGGKGQLAAAHAAMRDLDVSGVDIVALAKSRDLEEAPPADERRAARSPERVFLLGKKDPIVLPQNSAELFLLTRLRDESHRFAITFQKKLMRRKNFQSVLEEIPGIGEGRKKALLRHFGSLKRIRHASIEELAEVEGLGIFVAERIHLFLHGQRPAAPAAGEAAEDAVRQASLEDAGTKIASKAGPAGEAG